MVMAKAQRKLGLGDSKNDGKPDWEHSSDGVNQELIPRTQTGHLDMDIATSLSVVKRPNEETSIERIHKVEIVHIYGLYRRRAGTPDMPVILLHSVVVLVKFKPLLKDQNSFSKTSRHHARCTIVFSNSSNI